MSQSRNWKAYYSGDFAGYDLTIEGEVQSHRTLDVEPGLREADSPPITETIFHAQLVNAGDGDFKNVKEKFRVQSPSINQVIIFNERGQEEARVQVPPIHSKQEGTSAEV